MYEKFFGFKERPFQLVPNPAYLYLGKTHEDVLAHLTYAVSQGDGFVEITGEVGTGKTTLCRVFLGNLGENAEAAYIFNPMLDAVQLLKTINEEFGIDSTSDSTKGLIDRLNVFLMKKKRENKQVLLLIDESQNLNKDVLEQLRLLSNLETDTSKLLQIILVGQPELRDILDSYELRQLRQRITLSCHLRPLNLNETRDYIQHRIQIAAQRPGLKFTRDAYRAIYRYSKGIPRLINIVCDRSLLTAYGLDQHKITGAITTAAIQEISVRGSRKISPSWGRWAVYTAIFLCVAFLGAALLTGTMGVFPRFRQNLASVTGNISDVRPSSKSLPPDNQDENKPESIPLSSAQENDRFGPAHLPPDISSIASSSESASSPLSSDAGKNEKRTVLSPPSAEGVLPAPAAPVSAESSAPAVFPPEAVAPDGSDTTERLSETDAPPMPELEDALKAMNGTDSRQKAFETTLAQWNQNTADISSGLAEIDDPETFFQLAAAQKGFSLFPVSRNLNLGLIRRLNLPVIFELQATPEKTPTFLPLIRIHPNESLLFKNGGESISGTWNQLTDHWTGRAFIPWKNLRNLVGVIPINTSEASVMALKMLLREIGYGNILLTSTFDEPTRAAVKQVQDRHGLPVDGYVGPLTKIALYNELRPSEIPHLEDDARFSRKEPIQ